jgi:hypothetical protein
MAGRVVCNHSGHGCRTGSVLVKVVALMVEDSWPRRKRDHQGVGTNTVNAIRGQEITVGGPGLAGGGPVAKLHTRLLARALPNWSLAAVVIGRV